MGGYVKGPPKIIRTGDRGDRGLRFPAALAASGPAVTEWMRLERWILISPTLSLSHACFLAFRATGEMADGRVKLGE